jgi:hypothetical protein
MRFKIIAIITIFLSIHAFKGSAQSYSEYEVKLVYLYQFVKYFNWPEDSNNKEEFIIGLYGYHDFGNLADKMYADRKFNNKSCKVISIGSAEEAKSCDLIYVLGVSKFDAMQFLKDIKGQPILTVGDQLEDFCEIGGMINFTDKTDKQRLELCPPNVENANMQVSKQLYAIARIIDLDKDEF